MKSPDQVAEAEAREIKSQMAAALKERIRHKGTTISSLARSLNTSPAAVRRVLNTKNTSITLRTLVRTAHGLGFRVNLSMQPVIDRLEAMEVPSEVGVLADRLADALDQIPSR